MAGAERVFEIIDTPSEADDAAAAPLERVDIYVPGTPVIKHMTLEARPGEILALVIPTNLFLDEATSSVDTRTASTWPTILTSFE